MSDTVVGQPDAPERPRGRPRSAIADTAIREAAVELFAERGFEGVSIEDVAALAGVSRATIYRRYPSKVDLIVEAAGCLATNEIAFPDTGNLSDDLRGLAHSLINGFRNSPAGRVMPVMTFERRRYPELDDRYKKFLADRKARTRALLRRQALATRRVPLVCFTPKRYLRMPQSRSRVSELTEGGFRLTLDDRAELDRDPVRRVLLCTGKLGHELMDKRDELGAPAAVVRVEQLYPWPEDDILTTVAKYPNAREVWWVQEEPANMGAWNFAHARLARALRDRAELRHVAREASASPATGSQTIHEREQQQLLAAAFEGLLGESTTSED